MCGDAARCTLACGCDVLWLKRDVHIACGCDVLFHIVMMHFNVCIVRSIVTMKY